MGYIELLIILFVHICLFFFCLNLSKKIFFTPELIFTSCFIPQFVFSLFYIERWDLDLCNETIIVFIIGVITFFLFSLIFKVIFKIKINFSNNDVYSITLSKTSLYFFAVFQLISILLMSDALKAFAHTSDLFEAINIYGILSKDRGVSLPFFPAKLNLFSYLSGFVWIYYVIYSILYKKHSILFLLFLNLLLSFVSNMLTGSRGGIFQILMSGTFIYYFLWSEKNNWTKKITFKYLSFIFIGSILLICSFQSMLLLLGRYSSISNFSDYLALYICAEVKNLDIVISNGVMSYTDFWDWSTINNLLNKISLLFDFTIKRNYANSSTYIIYKGIDMGNVYTIYYSFVKDISFFGVFLFTSIMAILSQFFLKKALSSLNNKEGLRLSLVVYSYILTMLFFSFFGNWFYTNIFSTGFAWCLIIWFLISYLSEKKKFRFVFKLH